HIYPYDCICFIQTFTSPDTGKTATGFIIGPHTILTAAHVVAGAPTVGTLGSTIVNIYPGEGLPGTAISPIIGRYRISSEQPSGVGPSFAQNDFAIITVTAILGGQAFSLPPSAFSGGTVNVTGYPGAPPNLGTFAAGTQFNDIGTVYTDPQYAALDWDTQLDSTSLVTFPGNSGGPLWTMSGSTATAWGIASTS